MRAQGISLLYLPPFSIVARFFITASIMGLLGSLLALYMIVSGNFNLQALLHSFTLGFMATTMIGALFQMLPVVAGALIENPLTKARYLHVFMVSGIILLIVGMYSLESTTLIAGLTLTSSSLLFISFLMLYKLLRLKAYTPTSNGMRYAIGMLIIGIILGTGLALGLGGKLELNYEWFLKAHISFMLLGWVGILIASVAFQVIEMFFVTPPYPGKFANNFPILVSVSILLNILSPNSFMFKLPASLVFITFAVLTINRLLRRRRKIADPLIFLWLVGMVMLVLSMVVYPFTEFLDKGFLLFLFLYGSFAHSVILAMMYRIIPFLVWIHISNAGIPDAPTMYDVIKPKRAWRQLYIHVASMVSFGAAFSISSEGMFILSSMLYVVSFAYLFFSLLGGVLIYVKKANQTDASLQH